MKAADPCPPCGLYNCTQVAVELIACCENVSEAMFYCPGVLKAVVVYGTTCVTLTLALATYN